MNVTQLDPLSLTILLASLALIPLLLMVTTCFLKLAVVLNLVRNAMGVQQVPPNMVLNGICIALTLFIMAPVFHETQKIVVDLDLSDVSVNSALDVVGTASQPIQNFMLKHTSDDILALFQASAKSLWTKEVSENLGEDNMLILIPSFVISELQAAFEIAFLIFLPFIVIDLIVSNVLLALGMQMVSPMTVSLPLKILLFVLVGGWEKLLHALVLSYM